MSWTSVLLGHISWTDTLDLFIRLVVAGFCGIGIGFERMRRSKGAGVRTHIIVCCAAALFMIVSKYGFLDLSGGEGGTRGADPARIAAQVVSGISFLGAGVIFKHGGSIRGLTTAAGLWATAGIGLALGAGLYVVGVFMTVLMLLLQNLLHRHFMSADTMVVGDLTLTVENTEKFQEAWKKFQSIQHIQVTESSITYLGDGFVTYEAQIRTPHELELGRLADFLRSICEVKHISYITNL